MEEKFERNEVKIVDDETLETLKEINREYNSKLLKKLILLYGKDNAMSIYNKMKQEGDEELRELYEKSANSSSLKL